VIMLSTSIARHVIPQTCFANFTKNFQYTHQLLDLVSSQMNRIWVSTF